MAQVSSTETIDQDVSDQAEPRCSLCGAAAEGSAGGVPPLGWSADLIETSEGTRRRWVCGPCTRRFVRSIEAKLDHQWW